MLHKEEIIADNEQLNKEIQEYQLKETNKKQQSKVGVPSNLAYEPNQKLVEENEKLKKEIQEYRSKETDKQEAVEEIEKLRKANKNHEMKNKESNKKEAVAISTAGSADKTSSLWKNSPQWHWAGTAGRGHT